MVRRFYQTLALAVLISGGVSAQQGVHGPRTVNAANTIVNEYSNITADVPVGATSISVASSNLNGNGRFSGSLAPGDLIMIYQVQGVFIENQFSVGPTDTVWGRVVDYVQSGRYEFRQVLSVPNTTTINIDCGTTYSYNALNGHRCQVVRVPRYTTLTINNGGVLTCDDWNGLTGGVLAVEVSGNTVVNAGGSIDATGRGFRGGAIGDNTSNFGVNNTYSANADLGAEKGESVVGYQADYDFPWGGRYCRGAGANGGGGGDGHNAGGGGGANGPNSANPAAVWSGNGIPDPAYTSAWNLEPPTGTMQLRTAANSEGGGRGGYTFSDQNLNAGTTGPGSVSWGGDGRNHEATGLGGRALDYSTGRLFFGGGGGSGDQNQGYGGAGGDGGGLIYIMCYGTISGAGTVVANGNNGANATGPPPNSTSYGGRDGAGGGGGGGCIILNAVGGVSGISATANGGVGGNQVLTRGAFLIGPINEAEGPGGGGGGGYIAISSGAITRTVNGGNNGTTNSDALTEFQPNGATRGCPGTNNASITNFDITVTNLSRCAGQTATITPTITGTPPPGYVINYYTVSTGGVPVGSGASYTTGPLAAGTYTYWVGTCAGWWREPVVITVNTTPALPTLSSNSPICAGSQLNLFSNTVAGATYTWTGPNSFSSGLEDPSIAGATTAATGTYSLTITAGICASPQATISVTVNPTPAAPTVGSNSPLCSGQTLNLTSNTVAGATYSWTGPNSFTSSLEDPTIVGVTTAATGTYSLTVTVAGCTSAQSTVAVTVSNTPAAPTLSSNTPVCSGNALNLFSNTVAGGTYSWTGPNSFTSGVEDPTIAAATTAATGTYSLTITVGGCTSPQSTTAVVVNATPAAPTVGSNSPLCAGQTLNLTSNTYPGGTYSWTGPNSFSSTLEDPTIVGATTAATGTYSLTVTVNGCVSAQSTVSVVVSAPPGAPTLSSNTPVCSGNTLNLFSNTVAGGTYSWTGPNSFSSTLEDPSIAGATVAASGTYSLTITVGSCTSPQSTTSVTVNPTPAAPTAGSNSPICAGQTLNLTSNTVAGATYSWTGPNSFTSSLEDPSIAGATTAANGTYSLTVTVGGCTSAQSTVSVIVSPAPGAPTLSSNTPVCTGSTLNLFANTVAGGTYAWAGPNSFTSSVEDPVITGVTSAEAGTYSLTITVGGCVSPQSTTVVVVNQTPASPGAGSNTPVCEGQTLNLTTSTVAGGTYDWNGPTGYNSTLEDPSILNVTPAATGMYYVTVTVNGCTSPVDSVAVVVNALPAVSAGSDAAICIGDSTTLNGSGTGSMVWTNAAGLSCTTCPSPNASPGATVTYTLTLTDGNGCINTDSVIVTVNALPVASAGADAAYCIGDSTTLSGNGGDAYAWSPNVALNDSTLQSPVASPTVTTTYVLQVTDANGCIDTDSVLVTVNTLPAVSAGTDQSMCPAGNVPLNATGAQTYAWSPATGLSCTSCQSPVATPAVTTTYVVVGTDSNGCVNNDTVIVTVAPNLIITASADETICVGDSAALTTSGNGTYVWSPSATLSSGSAQSPNAGPSVTTTYTITVTDSAGCTGTDSVTVFVNQPVVSNITGANTICIGDSVTLSASSAGGDGAYTYTWTPGPISGSPVTVSPTVTTVYTLDVIDGEGCTEQQTVTVNVNPPLTLSSIAPVSACVGGSANLTASGSGGDNNHTYTWYPGPLTGASQTVTVTATQTYTVILTDGCGTPADTQVVTVTANQPPVVGLTADVTTGCGPLCVNFTGTSSGTCTAEAWDFGDNTTSSQSNPQHCYASAGAYDVIYTCTDGNGCIGSDTIASMITVFPDPVASFGVSPAGTIQLNGGTGDVCMVDASTGATIWDWMLLTPTGGMQTSSQQEPCFTITDTGQYTVVLAVVNAQGCVDSMQISFNAENPCTELFVPSAFSPNGDGMNDTFFVYGSCITFMQLEIYSRWGEQVFVATTTTQGWDGTWRGKDCEAAIFTYVLRGQMDDGTPIEMQGNITLTR